MKLKTLGVLTSALMGLGLASASNDAHATVITTENFYGNITSSYYNGRPLFGPPYSIQGSAQLTYDSPGHVTDFNKSWYIPGWGGESFDYNRGNSYNAGGGFRSVAIQQSLTPTTFDVWGADVSGYGGFSVEYYSRVVLDLTAGSGWIQEYYSQPGYVGNELIYFNLVTVNGRGAPFPSPVAGVPEPSTWVMMLLGLAGLGFLGYRKTTTQLPVA